jgi:hypothetical protein
MTLVHLIGHAPPEQGEILEKGILEWWKTGRKKKRRESWK